MKALRWFLGRPQADEAAKADVRDRIDAAAQAHRAALQRVRKRAADALDDMAADLAGSRVNDR